MIGLSPRPRKYPPTGFLRETRASRFPPPAAQSGVGGIPVAMSEMPRRGRLGDTPHPGDVETRHALSRPPMPRGAARQGGGDPAPGLVEIVFSGGGEKLGPEMAPAARGGEWRPGLYWSVNFAVPRPLSPQTVRNSDNPANGETWNMPC